MPTYEYECQACGARHEVFQGISEASLKKCPACGKMKLRRLIGAGAGFIFKGSGFYATDYRSKEYGEKAKAESTSGDSKAEKPKTDSATGGKGEAKAKPTPKPASAKE